MSDTRIKACDRCEGVGHIEGVPSNYCPVTGEPRWGHTPCQACDGSGEIEIELEPVEMDDLP